MTKQKERPVLFSGPMVRAILEDRKTHTRRILKENTDGCPYGIPGDRLWVRETCCSDGWSVHYAADNDHREFGETRYDDVIKLHHYSGGFSRQVPSIHMPRWASRITLEITGIKVERLQDISSADCIAEGIRENPLNCFGPSCPSSCNTHGCAGPRDDFQKLWTAINGPNSWSENPWVWVIQFKRIST